MNVTVLLFLLLALPSYAETYADSLAWQHTVRWRERTSQHASVLVRSIPDTSFPHAIIYGRTFTIYSEVWIFGQATLQCAPFFSDPLSKMKPYIRWADCGWGVLEDTMVVVDLFGHATGFRPQALRALAWTDSAVVVVLSITIGADR